MYRREFVAALGTGGLLAGCLSGQRGDRGTDSGDSTPTPAHTATSASDDPDTSLARHGVPPDICESSIRADPSIHAVVDPAFAADWSAHEITPADRHEAEVSGLVDEQTVVELAADGVARAYPLTVLNTHEVVNGSVGGSVVVTFCPLCSSGMVASRRVGGEATLFGVTGQLWTPERIFERASEKQGRTFGATYAGGEEVSVRHNENLVMYDAATGSYWSQILARGICGSRAGTELEIRPSTVTTWEAFRDRRPNGEVLLPPPHSETVEPGVVLGDG